MSEHSLPQATGSSNEYPAGIGSWALVAEDHGSIDANIGWQNSGAVVTRSGQQGAVIGGVPAKLIGMRSPGYLETAEQD